MNYGLRSREVYNVSLRVWGELIGEFRKLSPGHVVDSARVLCVYNVLGESCAVMVYLICGAMTDQS